jgi:hypothetical protein
MALVSYDGMKEIIKLTRTSFICVRRNLLNVGLQYGPEHDYFFCYQSTHFFVSLYKFQSKTTLGKFTIPRNTIF